MGTTRRGKGGNVKPQELIQEAKKSNAKHQYADPGNHAADHYKPHMSYVRFKIREFLVPFVVEETPVLFRFQQFCRTKFLDEYFIHTANLGSHTFYVLCLPMSRWLCFSKTARDLVFLLGYSIYASGYVKDFCCLPRPRSPPLQRITHSPYTTKEYGAPSSHTANATAVTLFMIYYIFYEVKGEMTWTQSIGAMLLLFLYYSTLTVGRVYSGMHGLFDIESGIVIGAAVFVVRLWVRDYMETLLLHWWYPVCNIALGLFLLFAHINPVDECPCFKDSVAFVGVVGGLEFADWLYPYVFQTANYELNFPDANSGLTHLSVWTRLLIRVFIGVACVVLWKEGIAAMLASKLGLGGTVNVEKTENRENKINKQNSIKKTTEVQKHDLEIPLHRGVSASYILWKYFVYAMISFVSVIVAPMVFKLCGVY